MRYPAFFLAGLLAALCVAPAAAQHGAPVSIHKCAPVLTPVVMTSPSPSFLGIPIASKSNGMQIIFVNDGPKTAKLVDFAVDSNGSRFVIRDVGTFSPGISIDHSYSNGAGQGFLLPQFIAPNVACSVSSVEFTDGSTWRKGQPPAVETGVPPATAGGLHATPKHVQLDMHSESALFMIQAPGRVAGLKETNNCQGIAAVYSGASGDNAMAYEVKPLGPGSCASHVIDQNGATATVPIVVR